MKTNVYKASYNDLSELTVNAENMSTALAKLKELRKEEDPSIVRKIISNITIPEPEPPIPKIPITVTPLVEEGELPDTVTVRPTEVQAELGSSIMLYAIDTASVQSVEFVGWYLGVELLSIEENFLYEVPSVEPSEPINITAKFRNIV